MTCTCTITGDGRGAWQIQKCRLCESAPAMYEACTYVLENWSTVSAAKCIAKLSAAIKAAEAK